MENKEKFKWQMLELSDGITTSNGNWYHITRDGIEKYIPGLLKKYSLEDIIKLADAWQKSPNIFSLLLYFGMVFIGLNAPIAASITIIFYIIWFYNMSSFVLPLLNPVVKIIQSDGFIYVISAAALIYLSYVNLPAMWIGMVLLFLLKVGLLPILLKYLREKSGKNASQEDRVLNILLIRLGIKNGLMTRNIEDMEQELLRVVNYHKERKK